jgi:hypothetical protein
MDFEISALIGMNLADLKSLVSVGEVLPDPTESRRKKSPASRKRFKLSLISPPMVVHFEPDRETVIQVDASRKNGMGCAPMQRHDGSWRLVDACWK